jgi:hypothetical protein
MENTIINNENNAEFLAKRITDLLGLIALLEKRLNEIEKLKEPNNYLLIRIRYLDKKISREIEERIADTESLERKILCDIEFLQDEINRIEGL